MQIGTAKDLNLREGSKVYVASMIDNSYFDKLLKKDVDYQELDFSGDQQVKIVDLNRDNELIFEALTDISYFYLKKGEKGKTFRGFDKFYKKD